MAIPEAERQRVRFRPAIEPKVPLRRLLRVASVAGGIQFGWALQLSLLTPYVQELGIPHAWASVIWLCGPLSGLLVQPLVGHMSDRCTSRFGRRRPFILAGAVSIAVSVLIIGFSADIGWLLGDQGKFRPRAVAVFVHSLFSFMDHILKLDDLLYDSYSDDELEIISTFAMAKERLDSERGSIQSRGSRQRRKTIYRNSLQGQEILFVIISLHRQYFLPINFRGGFKMTAAIRMFAYGVTADFMDEYLRIGETTANDSFKLFLKRMLGSIDCMHWKWKNFPNAWKCMYSGHIREPTVILEVMVSYDLWIWHAFFRLLWSHNDINVLERSSVFTNLAEGRAPRSTTHSMVTTIRWDTISPMAYILRGQHS
ncbi:hypothetical protein SLA2020_452550 [Shorea laevis]